MPKTYNELYFQVRNELKQAGVEAFGQEARILLASACDKTEAQLMRDMNLYTSGELEKKVMDMLDRRLSGEPLAYVAGSWEFYGLPMIVTPDVLIPRMDTEVLVDAALSYAKLLGRKLRVLDLCCGSGCIACAVASRLQNVSIFAADVSSSALEICRKNISLNRLSSKILTIYADALSWPPHHTGGFDMILSNPPYIPSSEIAGLDASVRDYEPHGALDGGEDGLDFYRAIIKHWTVTLRPNGLMIFEVGENQAEDVKQMLLEAGFISVDSRNDTLGIERVVIGQWKNEF